MIAITIHFMNSFDNEKTIPVILAPKTFLIPISFVFISATNDAKPNKPRQAIKMERSENIANNSSVCFSLL